MSTRVRYGTTGAKRQEKKKPEASMGKNKQSKNRARDICVVRIRRTRPSEIHSVVDHVHIVVVASHIVKPKQCNTNTQAKEVR